MLTLQPSGTRLDSNSSQALTNPSSSVPAKSMPSRKKRRAGLLACAGMLVLLCASQALADGKDAGITILDVSPSLYRPAPGASGVASDEDACKAWSLDKQQAASAWRLSRELREGELHDYYWLPCSIKGHARIQGATWEFEINAAGTSTWRNGNATHLMGCSQLACKPLIILMPDRDREPGRDENGHPSAS